MTLLHPSLPVLLSLSLLAGSVHAQAPAPALPPQIQAEHAAALAAYERGDDATALLGFRRAYAALLDPIAERAERDLLLGALRSTWARLHAKTGDIVHLCAWRSALKLHLETLMQALGSAAVAEDTAGLYELLDEANATLARAAPASCDPPASSEPSKPQVLSDASPPTSITTPQLPPEPLHPLQPIRSPRRVLAGQLLVGLGACSLLGTGAALMVLGDRYRRIIDLDASLPDGAAASPSEADRVRTLEGQGEGARIAAIVTGVAGVGMLATGITLWITGRRAAPAGLTVVPVAAPGLWGLTLRRRF